MSPPVTTESASLILSIGVTVVAVLLIVWHWFERPHREAAESEEDRRYYTSQSIRRWIVSVTMLLIAIGIYAGSQMKPMIGGKPNMLFLQTWLWVCLLVLGLVVIAILDWFATRIYSFRKRKAMAREGIDLLRDEIRVRASIRQEPERLDEGPDDSHS
jgi:hypothetical protein